MKRFIQKTLFVYFFVFMILQFFVRYLEKIKDEVCIDICDSRTAIRR